MLYFVDRDEFGRIVPFSWAMVRPFVGFHGLLAEPFMIPHGQQLVVNQPVGGIAVDWKNDRTRNVFQNDELLLLPRDRG
jgi:hypothetical protein